MAIQASVRQVYAPSRLNNGSRFDRSNTRRRGGQAAWQDWDLCL